MPEPRTTLAVDDSIKMLRETFCVAQTAIGQFYGPLGEPRVQEHIDRLQRLAGECDRQRPLGQDGKHGGGPRCTPTCGCEDSNQGPAAGFRSTDEALDWLRSIVVPVYGDVRSTGGLLAATGEIAHPSRHGGNRTLWDRFEAAKQLIDSSNPRPAYWKKAP